MGVVVIVVLVLILIPVFHGIISGTARGLAIKAQDQNDEANSQILPPLAMEVARETCQKFLFEGYRRESTLNAEQAKAFFNKCTPGYQTSDRLRNIVDHMVIQAANELGGYRFPIILGRAFFYSQSKSILELFDGIEQARNGCLERPHSNWLQRPSKGITISNCSAGMRAASGLWAQTTISKFRCQLMKFREHFPPLPLNFMMCSATSSRIK